MLGRGRPPEAEEFLVTDPAGSFARVRRRLGL